MSSMPARRTSSCVFPIWEPLCVCVCAGGLCCCCCCCCGAEINFGMHANSRIKDEASRHRARVEAAR